MFSQKRTKSDTLGTGFPGAPTLAMAVINVPKVQAPLLLPMLGMAGSQVLFGSFTTEVSMIVHVSKGL